MNERETLKLALEALEDIRNDCAGCDFEWNNDYPLQAKAHAAIKETLAQEKSLQALHDENERLGLYKEAYAQPEQEPVAFDVWLQECESMTMAVRHGVKFLLMPEESAVRIGTAIQNTTPPTQQSCSQRTAAEGEDTRRAWVRLMDEEIEDIFCDVSDGDYLKTGRLIEAKLKEKNT